LLHYAAGKVILRERGERERGERERLRIQMSRAEVGKAGSFLQVNSQHQGVFPAPSFIHPPLSLSHTHTPVLSPALPWDV